MASPSVPSPLDRVRLATIDDLDTWLEIVREVEPA